ncbi:hypothetical protein AOQ84DRAFT_438522 [Glonium stellatum]|uniref:Uncharacterized protein n=1 Tax=Glonium stellatum TaxID=574774 RepID=A0A8E2F4U8_9PEZI|nr:hypothetical protein AOQ84DRAFT_438522 [Glonium stellatum]
MNRPNLKPTDHDQLATLFPGATRNAIAIRLSKLRIEQRKAYEALGWPLPEVQAARTVGPRKKSAKDQHLALPTEKNIKARKPGLGIKEEVKSDNGGGSDEGSQPMRRHMRTTNRAKRRRVDSTPDEGSLQDEVEVV